MQIKMRGNKVGVEKSNKPSKNSKATFIVIPDAEEHMGIIKYLGDGTSSDLKLGQRVYFSNEYQMVKIKGDDICVMDDSNVLAVVDEEVRQEV